MPQHWDQSSFREAMGGPGSDPRQWLSYGTVQAETADASVVDFDTIDGVPMVMVTLNPSGAEVPCIVASGTAGNGEAEWFPFIPGDQVLVAIPQGNERAGCCIIGRVGNETDKFPSDVAGQSTSDNKFAFRRLRTPYVLETASTYLLRSATTTGFMSLDKTGQWTIASGDGHYMAIQGSFITMQTLEGDYLVQIDFTRAKAILLRAGNAMFTLASAADSLLMVPQRLLIATSGSPQATGHGLTVESLCSILLTLFAAIGTTQPGALLGASLAAAIPTTILPAAIAAAVAFPFNPANPVAAPSYGALQTALAVPPDPTGLKPGFGSPGLLF